MNYTIQHAELRKEDGEYIGFVRFQVEGHPDLYELTMQSKDGRDWGYSLHFAGDSGIEDNISAVDEWLDEDDDAFDAFVEAAIAALQQ